MPVIILGFHRSGTSLVTHLLSQCGLYLGPGHAMMPPVADDNPEGYWEHLSVVKINDQLLSVMGGSWQALPSFRESWFEQPEIQALIPEARAIFKDYPEPWGWKDPRTMLTLPFWLKIFPEARFICCLRNPLEIVQSFNTGRTNRKFSPEESSKLWLDYHDEMLRWITVDQPIITHYDSYLYNPVSELRRVVDSLEIPTLESAILQACNSIKLPLKHHSAPEDAINALLGQKINALYGELADRAGNIYQDIAADVQYQAEKASTYLSMRQALESQFGTRISDLEAQARSKDEQLAQITGQKEELQRELRWREQTLLAQSGLLIEREQHLRKTLDQVAETERELEQKAQAIATLQAKVEQDAECIRQQTYDINTLQFNYQTLAETLDSQRFAYQNLLRELQAIQATGFWRLITSWWRFEQKVLPPNARQVGLYRFLVNSLRKLTGRKVDNNAGVSPSTSSVDNAPAIDNPVSAGTSAAISAPSPTIEWDKFRARFHDVIDRHWDNSDHELSILDWNTKLDLMTLFPRFKIFAPPAIHADTVATLPYLEQTIDVVVLSSDEADRIAEAKRIATRMVINLKNPDKPDQTPDIVIEWQSQKDNNGSLPSASIIIPSFNHIDYTKNCLKQLSETVPQSLDAEFLVIDDCSPDVETQRHLDDLASIDKRVRVIRNAKNGGFVAVCNQGVQAATGDVVVMLNNDTLPQPGWLQPLLRLLRDTPDAGAVGGKLIYPNGMLQEAGCAIFSDGSAWNFGKHCDPEDPLFNYMREVDYCSGALLASWRSLWNKLGGFDPRYSPGYYEDSDYCLRIRQSGYRVYYQPESVVVHFEGTTNGTDANPGDLGIKAYQKVNQRQFLEKWGDVLKDQPQPFAEYNMINLQLLAAKKRA